MAENSVGLQPNVTCEFKRAGFLEWRNDWNLAADWAATKPVIDDARNWLATLGANCAENRNTGVKIRNCWLSQLSRGSVNSAVDLLVPHFKKIAPFEFSHSVRAKADTKPRPSLLPSLVNWVELKKGMKRFSVRNKHTATS